MKTPAQLANVNSTFLIAVGTLCLACGSIVGSVAAQDTPSIVKAFLSANCLQCHQGEDGEGGFDIESLDWASSQGKSFDQLVRAVERVSAGEMPPKSEPKLDETSKTAFLGELSDTLVTLDRNRIATNGRAMKRRLNSYEYENSLRDILNLPWIPIRDMLPEDGESHRFNKLGGALDVSHVQLSRYLSAADSALRQALVVKLNQPERTTKRYYARDEFSLVFNFWPRENGTLSDRLSFPVLDSNAQPDVRSGEAPKTSPETREREAVGRVSSIFSDAGGYRWSQFQVPASGRYKLRFKGYSIWVSGGGIGRWFYEGFGDEKAPVYHLPLWHRPNADEVWPGRRSEPMGVFAQSSGKSRPLGEFDFGVEPTECEIEATLVANEVIQSDGLRFFRARVNGSDEQYVNPLATPEGLPGYAIQWMEVDGPLEDPDAASGYDLMFGDLPIAKIETVSPYDLVLQVPATPQNTQPSPEGPNRRPGPRGRFGGPRTEDIRVEVKSENPREDAQRLLGRFIDRVYRQPAEPQQVERFMQLFDHQISEGFGFTSSMLTVYTAVLASPGFLFIDEAAGKLDDRSIASRLGFFLWNSEPDLELRELAAQQQLRQPNSLTEQVDRMLDDPRSKRFIDAFTDYWLDLRKIDDTSPSSTLYNDYELNEPLKQSTLDETRLFVAKLIADDLPARNVVDSDFTFLNERLAEHYGLTGVHGSQMRYVQLPEESVRGGLMTQASVLKVTANGTTTSPVIRGNWITERILGVRIPPPPPVPSVEPDIRGAVSIRQQLEKHRADASCASCHSKMDPPGFALESFDVMGGYRERYRAVSESVQAVSGTGMDGQAFSFHYALPVDCAGELPDGSPFNDVNDLKKLLLRDERGLARNIASQLTIYGTGAPTSFSDRAVIEKILDQTEESDFGVRSLIHAIVQSELFLNK